MRHLTKHNCKVGVLFLLVTLIFTSCTLNDDDEVFESMYEVQTTNDHNEDADPEIEDPNDE